jgi:hypothetical protein
MSVLARLRSRFCRHAPSHRQLSSDIRAFREHLQNAPSGCCFIVVYMAKVKEAHPRNDMKKKSKQDWMH